MKRRGVQWKSAPRMKKSMTMEPMLRAKPLRTK